MDNTTAFLLKGVVLCCVVSVVLSMCHQQPGHVGRQLGIEQGIGVVSNCLCRNSAKPCDGGRGKGGRVDDCDAKLRSNSLARG